MEQGRVGKRGLQVIVWAVVLAAVGVSMASLQQAPIYEAVARVMVEESGEYRGVPPTELVMHAIESRPVAEATIQRLGLETAPAELLENLSVEQIEYTRFIVLSYEDTDPHRATQIVNTVGQVSSELSERSAAGNEFTVGLYKSAIIPENPVSPHPWRNGLLTLAIGLALCAWTAPAGGTASPA